MTDIPTIRWATTVDGASIAYQDFGRGPVAMVMVHGFLTHLEIYWESPRNAWSMRRYAKDLRILQFDKRGLGMSDRAATAPTLEIQMDDIRAVLDAAGVERAVVWASGSPGPALAAFFAAAHPERIVAMWLDGNVMEVGDDDYPWVESAEELEAWMDQVGPGWGSEGASTLEFARQCWPEAMDDPALRDPAFLRWLAKLARNAATPTSLRRFEEMWMATDVRPILRTICVPTAVALHEGQGQQHRDEVDYLVGNIPGARAVRRAAAARSAAGAMRSGTSRPSSGSSPRSRTRRQRSTGCWRPCSSPTSWARRRKAARSAMRAGRTLLGTPRRRSCGRMLGRYRGRVIHPTGDGFLATFDGPARAVRCAQAICEAVKPLGIEVRAGCHTGEIELMGADVGGIAVHIGARVGALAGPSEVLVSSTVKDLVAGSGLVFEDRGEHTLKGVPETWRLYAVAA